jgi:hypothetical protein
MIIAHVDEVVHRIAKYLEKISKKNNTLESRMAKAYNVSKCCEVMNN